MQLDNLEGGIAAAACEIRRVANRIALRLPSQDQTWLNHAVGHYTKELARLRRRVRSGDWSAEYAQTQVLLTSFTGRLAGLIRVAEGSRDNILPEPLSRKALEELANSFALDEPLPGTAKLVLISQGSKPPRVALEFGWQARAAHLLVADVLHAKGVVNRYDFNAPGRGRDRAGAQIASAILDGYTDWITFDFKNFYSSVGPKHLKWLDLPPKVMRHSVFCNAEMPIVGPTSKDRLKAARHGLPIGAMLSGKIASGLIGRMLRDIPGDFRAWSYVDDVAIGARSPAETTIIADANTKVVENNPAGPLAFKFFEIADAVSGFSFLNYRFRLEGRDGEPHVHIHPDHAAFNNLRDKLDRMLTVSDFDRVEDKMAAASEHADRWRSAHPLWDANSYAVANLRSLAESFAADHGTVCAKKHVPLLGPGACIGSAHPHLG
jgi:hypothetical protein